MAVSAQFLEALSTLVTAIAKPAPCAVSASIASAVNGIKGQLSH